MNVKWKAISAVMALITFICAIYIVFYIKYVAQDMDESISLYSRSLSGLVEFVDRSNRRQFQNRIKSFVNYRVSPAREKLILAFRDRNRAELLVASRPFLEILKKESPYFASMAWILPDNTAFLRVHKPELYGDYVADMRPDIAEVNTHHRQVSGFAVGIAGMQFRVVQPVFYHNQYLGAVQFGIDARELLDAVKQEFDVSAALLIKNERYAYVKRPVLPSFTGEACSVQAEEIKLFQSISNEMCARAESFQYKADNRHYVIKKILGLPDYRGENIGWLIAALDITGFYDSVIKAVIWAVLFTVAVLVLSCLILNFSFEKILKRVVELNQSLEEEKKNLVRRVEERTEELEKKAEEYEQIAHAIESSIDGVMFTDLQLGITYMNRAALEMSGYELNEVLGQQAELFAHDKHIIERVILPAMHRDGYWSGSLKARIKGGETMDVLVSATFIRKPDQTPVGMAVILRDLSDIRRLEKEKKAVEQQLHQAMKMEAIGRLAGGIAHDFNNILNVINGYAELALMETSPGEPLRDRLTNILKAGTRAASLTQQLLAFSRKQIINVEPVVFNELLKDIHKMTQRILGEDIDITLDTYPGLWPVMVDRSQFEQIVMNLVVNARDAMPSGGRLTIETANVTVDEEYSQAHYKIEPGDYVMIAVSDTGAGMSEEVKAKIFEPFFTTKEQGRGTGLGLATVYGIVKQNNGFIMVYSEPGHGTTFKILIPRVEAAENGEDIGLPDDKAVFHYGTETILLVEDDPGLCRLAEEMLSDLGYTVFTANRADEALNIFKARPDKIHMLLTDVVMPDMSGPELAEKLKKMQPDVKILFMSGYTENAIVHKGILKFGIRFLHKPFSIRSLAEAVRKVLDGEQT